VQAVNLYVRWLVRLQLPSVVGLYARFVLTRSDFVHCAPHPPIDFEHIWHPRGEEDWYGLTDRHSVYPAALVLTAVAPLWWLFEDPSRHVQAMRSDARGELTSSVDAVLRGLGPFDNHNYSGLKPLLDKEGKKADWQSEQLLAYHYQMNGLLPYVRGGALPALIVRESHASGTGAWTRGTAIHGLGLRVKYPVMYYNWHPICKRLLVATCADAAGQHVQYVRRSQIGKSREEMKHAPSR